jgi:hypothetical protein
LKIPDACVALPIGKFAQILCMMALPNRGNTAMNRYSPTGMPILRANNAARRLVLRVQRRCKIFHVVLNSVNNNMTLTHQQLAELLAGIARSQQAIVDAMDRAQPGFRGTYLLPTLNVAANLRIPQVRLLDLPSRILLRSQGRVPMDAETIQRALQEALDGSTAFDPPPAPPPAIPAVPAISAEAEDAFFQS